MLDMALFPERRLALVVISGEALSYLARIGVQLSRSRDVSPFRVFVGQRVYHSRPTYRRATTAL
jgi:hypothetical protein